MGERLVENGVACFVDGWIGNLFYGWEWDAAAEDGEAEGGVDGIGWRSTAREEPQHASTRLAALSEAADRSGREERTLGKVGDKE